MDGIARIRLGAEPAWQWINFNLLGPDLLKSEAVIPQIAVDPVNGKWAHQIQRTCILSCAVPLSGLAAHQCTSAHTAAAHARRTPRPLDPRPCPRR